MQTNVKRYEIGGVRIKLEADFGIGEERNFELFEAEFDGFYFDEAAGVLYIYDAALTVAGATEGVSVVYDIKTEI